MNALAQVNTAEIDTIRQDSVAKRLCERTPDENFKHMRTVSINHGMDMRIEMQQLKNESGGYDFKFLDAKFPKNATNETRRKVVDAFKKMLMPAPKNTVLFWLSKLSIRATTRDGSKVDDAARLDAYYGDLEGYPADVVKYALSSKHYDWWPSSGKIVRICDEQVENRIRVIRKLENLIARHEYDQDKPQEFDDGQSKAAKFQSIDQILKGSGFVPKVAWSDAAPQGGKQGGER